MRKLHFIAILVCTLSAGLAKGTSSRDPGPVPGDRFDRLLGIVIAGQPALHRRFAEVALRALIAVNRAELSRRPDQDPGPVGWRGGAAQFVARLELAYAQLENRRDVIVIRERRGVVRLTLDDEQVMLSAPRLSAQDALDARIAEEMCRELECDVVSPAPDVVDEHARQVRQEWIFGDNFGPTLSTSDGLNCAFQDTLHLRLKERTCTNILRELRLLGDALRAVVQHGSVLAWDVLALVDAKGSPTRVVYAQDGSFFNLELRYLQASPVIWREAIPWLQARLRGHAGYYMIKVPDTLIYLKVD